MTLGAAYVLWGLSPIFWKALGGVPAVDTAASRVVWSFVLLAGVHTVRRSWPTMLAVAANRRNALTGMVTGALVVANWLIFIWAIGEERLTEAALGYFINPLFSVFLGVVFLREKMRSVQWLSVALAGAGVVWLTVEVGRVPWVALSLAGTFGLYGLLRKTADFGSLDGLTLETGAMFVFAAGFLLVQATTGHGIIGPSVPGQSLLLLCTGVVTAAPLLLFASGARMVPLSVVGLMQYINPTMQFLLGVVAYGEVFDRQRFVGYAMIWVALGLFAFDSLRFTRGTRTAAAVPRLS